MPTDAAILPAQILSLAKMLGHVQPLAPEAVAALQALR